MNKETAHPILSNEGTLSEQEATELAEELKAEIRKGNLPSSNQSSIERLIAGLGDRRGLVRRTFTETLGIIGKEASPALTKALLSHQNVVVRRAAAKALRIVKDPSSLPCLLHALLNDKDAVVQGSSVGAMAVFGESAVKLLLEALINPEISALQAGFASWGISYIGAKAPESIREAAESSNELIRTAAIAALGEQIQCLDDKKAKYLLIKALDDSSYQVRAAATSLLGQLQDPSWAENLLCKKLVDKEPCVRKNAALALMKLRVFSSVDTIKVILLTEEEEEVRSIFKLVIHQLENHEFT